MAWTAPMTFTANTVLTAAQLNTHLRDNLMETAPAKATVSGSVFVGNGLNSIVERVIAVQRIDAFESTASTSYTNLATVGPAVTVTTGSRALVWIAASVANATTNSATLMSFDITGATTVAALDSQALENDGAPGGQPLQFGTHNLVTGLTPGSNTFTMKYRVGSSTGTFGRRLLTVFPL